MKPAAPLGASPGGPRDGERLQRSPHKDPERRPGLRPGRLRCQSGRTSALREARTAHKFAGLADLAGSGDKNGATLRISPEMKAIAVRPTSFWSLR